MKKQIVLTLVGFFTVSTSGLAEITTDGTVGTKGQLSGPNFHIGQELGSLRGNNLFHSFGRFNLNRNESATFTGDNHIKNVISRVTGGSPSSINGTLKSAIGRAAFYFINPAGIVFGQNAQVDVPGAFYASTAGELKFADGTKFSAVNPQGNTLSMAAPEAFGFLGKQTGTMALNGADLVFKPGASVHLSAGMITMDNASLKGEGMDLQIASVGSSTQALLCKTLPNKALQGAITIKDTVLDASGNGKGRIVVRSGGSEAVDSNINANNLGNMDMPANQGIDMRVGGLKLLNSIITSSTNGKGKAGIVKVNAQKDLEVINGSQITTKTSNEGNAGDIFVKASEIIMDGHNAERITVIMSAADKDSNGGNAGNVIVDSENLRIDGQNADFATGIYSTTSKGALGNSGTIIVNIQKKLTILNTGTISSATDGIGDGGTVNINAETIWISNPGNLPFSTGIDTNAFSNSSGNAGKVIVNAFKSLTLLNGGSISSGTSGKGNAGNVVVKAETIKIFSTIDSFFSTGINSEVSGRGEGNPGLINIDTTKFLSMRGGAISINSGELSNNPIKTNAKITISTPQLILSNGSTITAQSFSNLPASPIEINTSQLSMDNSKITTAAVQSDGGPITINAEDWALLNNSQITTSVGRGDVQFTNIGNGGDITLNTDVLVLDTGFIQANTNAINASGGDINLNVKQLVASGGNLHSGGDTPLKFKPDSGINVIQAAAPDGINGTITNTAPQLNIVGALAGLNTPQLDLNRVGHDPCSSIVQQSTMKKLGKGGIPYFNKGQDGYTIDRLLPKKHDRSSQTADLAKALPASHDCRPKTSSHDHKM